MEVMLAVGIFKSWPKVATDVLFVTDNHKLFALILALVKKDLVSKTTSGRELALHTTHVLCREYGSSSLIECLAAESE